MAGAPAFSFEQLGAHTAPAPSDPLESGGPAALAAHELEAQLDAARAEGYQQGIQAAQSQLAGAVSAFGQGVEELARERAGSADMLEREAVELGLQIADKVVSGALSAQPELVLSVVEGALRRLVERQSVLVLVSPDDLELVRESAEAFRNELGGIERLDIQSERRVPRGGCVLRTSAGEVDARVGAQLERAREAIESELGG